VLACGFKLLQIDNKHSTANNNNNKQSSLPHICFRVWNNWRWVSARHRLQCEWQSQPRWSSELGAVRCRGWPRQHPSAAYNTHPEVKRSSRWQVNWLTQAVHSLTGQFTCIFVNLAITKSNHLNCRRLCVINSASWPSLWASWLHCRQHNQSASRLFKVATWNVNKISMKPSKYVHTCYSRWTDITTTTPI